MWKSSGNLRSSSSPVDLLLKTEIPLFAQRVKLSRVRDTYSAIPGGITHGQAHSGPRCWDVGCLDVFQPYPKPQISCALSALYFAADRGKHISGSIKVPMLTVLSRFCFTTLLQCEALKGDQRMLAKYVKT